MELPTTPREQHLQVQPMHYVAHLAMRVEVKQRNSSSTSQHHDVRSIRQ
jgi:hypothetical protein